MALSYQEIRQLYDPLKDAGATQEDLPAFSQRMNELTGTNFYDAGLHDNIVKRASYGIDQLLEKTGAPQVGADVGRAVGELVGAPEAGEEIGRKGPRTLLNFAPLLIPGGGALGTALKLGATGALTGAETYTDTDSKIKALLSAGTAIAAPSVTQAAEQAILKRIGARPLADAEGNIIRYVAEKAPQKIASFFGGQSAAAGFFGASGAGQELLSGEPVSSPFSRENLLNLTLGQVPFALTHLGGKLIKPGPKPAEVSKALDLSDAAIKLKAARKELDDKTDLEKLPDVTRPAVEDLTPEQYRTAAETRRLLASVRKEQLEVKDNPNLTDEQKIEQQNNLLNQDFALQREREADEQSDTILGNGIHPTDERTTIIGKQRMENRTGTWRAVEVLDDPRNPEELRGRVIAYPTKGEKPNVHYPMETLNANAPVGEFNIPDSQWWSHNKSVEEWNNRYKKPTTNELQPELPQGEALTDEQVSYHLNELKNIHDEAEAANTPADLQKAVVQLNGVESENDLPTTNDKTLGDTANKLVDAGFDPNAALKAAVKSRTRKVARQIKAVSASQERANQKLLEAGFDQETINKMDVEQRLDALAAVKSLREQERDVAPLSKEDAAKVSAQFEAGEGTNPGFSVITADKLTHKAHGIEDEPFKDIVEEQALAAAQTPEAAAKFKEWFGDDNSVQYAEDYANWLELIRSSENGSTKNVDPEEAAKLLNLRDNTNTWDKDEVEEFLSRPHVQEWNKALDDGIKKMQQTNGAFVPSGPRLVEPTEQTKANLEKELFALPEDQRKTVLDLQARAAKVVQDTQAQGQQIGVPLEQINREALGRSDALTNLWNKHGVTLADEVAKYQQILGEEPKAAPGSRGDATAPIWVPEEQRDVDTISKLGVNEGGVGMVNYLKNSNNLIFAALGKDLEKFTDSLQRIRGVVRDTESGAFTRRLPGDKFEISISPSVLREPDFEQQYTVAHELVHGLTMAELGRPTNRPIYDAITNLRNKVISKLPKDMQEALTNMEKTDWYNRYIKGEADTESMMPGGTNSQHGILYGLLSNEEFVAQGLSEHSFRQFLKTIKTGKENWFSTFTNYVKQLLKLGENISNSAFEEFLSKTDQLITRGNYVSGFKNYANRYFENLGMSDQFIRSNTQRAMSLLLSNPADPQITNALIRQGAGGVRTPEWTQANRDVQKMFRENGEDAQNTLNTLNELGHEPSQKGLTDLADSLMLGEERHDALDVLPEAAARYIFETAKDSHNLVSSILAAATERNQGLLNLADAKGVRENYSQYQKMLDKVLDASRLHDMQVRDIQGLFGVSPDNYAQDQIFGSLSNKKDMPDWAVDETKKSWLTGVQRFLQPIGQLVRTVGQPAREAFNRGWQLQANQRKMMSEALKAFGMDLTNMTLTKQTVKNMEKALQEPRLTTAVNKWIYENQAAGKRTGETRVIDANDPRIVNIIGKLSPQDRDIVEDIVNKHQISMQHMQEQILEKGLQIASTNAAVVAQRAQGGKLADNVALAEQLLRAFTTDRSDPNAAALADSQIQQVQNKMDPDAFLALARFTKAAADSWQQQREWFKNNPAWSTAQRYGKLLVEYRKGGKTYVDGVDSRKEAEQIAGGRPFKLTKNSQYDEDRPPILGHDAVGIVTKLREYEQTQADIMRNRGFSQDDINQFLQYSPSAQFATEETYRGGVPNLTPPPRGLTKGAAELPWLRNHFSWVAKSSNYWSRQLLRAQARAHLSDPEIAQNEQLRRDLQTHYDNILQPDSQVGRLAQRAAMTWFMGFNPASALINATQPFLTHVAELTSMTGKPLDSYRRVLSALKEIYSGGLTRKEWKDPEIDHLIKEAYSAGELDASMYDPDAAAQESIHTNYKRLLSGNRAQTTGQRLSTTAGSFAQASMMMFRTVERINNMAALIASYKYYRESQPNLSPDQAIQKAFEFNHAVNFGGGRAQRPIGAFSGRGAFPRTAAMLATSMQSYNLGTAFQLARYIKSGFFRPEGATPHEIYSARKAVVQMLGTQLAAAGVLGLPFVSGMLAVLNSAFPDLELNRKLRETMAGILGGDKENGSVLNDIAMTGAPSMLGWDLQSRLSMGNTLPGVSEVNGFQPENLLGAPANLVTNFIKGGVKLASGDVSSAVDSLAPSALKKIEQLLRSGGQVLDYRNRPIFTPTIGETVGIALGFNPKRLSDFNAASRIARQTDDNIKRREGEFHQQMASEALKGNFGTVRQALLQRSREEPTYDPVSAVRSIAGAAEELTFPRDLRREGTIRSSDVRGKLLESFNIPPTQPSEVARLQFRQGIQQRLGLFSSSPTGLPTATLMDQLREAQPQASRAELRRQATLLLHGRRLTNLSLQEP